MKIEPSVPPGDAPCPYCGSLLWFVGAGSPGGASAAAIEKTKQQIHALVGEIATLSEHDLDQSEFYHEFLIRVVQVLAAIGGAVWLLDRPRWWPARLFARPRLELVCQLNIPTTLHQSAADESKSHQRLLENVVATNEGKLVPPLCGATDVLRGGNPTQQLLVIHPLHRGGRVWGLVEIFQRANTTAATQRGYLVFLEQMCHLAASQLDQAVVA